MRPLRVTHILVWALLVAVCATGCSGANDAAPIAADPTPSSEPTTPVEPVRDPAAPPVVVGVSSGNLVRYDPLTDDRSVLVQGVAEGGALSISPDGQWLAFETVRRWDGLDTIEVAFVNLATQSVRFLSEAEGQQLYSFSVQPLGWGGGVAYYTDLTAFGFGGRGDSAIDLQSGAVIRLPDGIPGDADGWVRYEGEVWSYPLQVPNPEPDYPGEFDDGMAFWGQGPMDVSDDGQWAVGNLYGNYVHSNVDDMWPVYLLGSDGSYEPLPLVRPAVFAGTLGVE